MVTLETVVHRALSSPVRVRLLTVLLAAGGGLDVRELAKQTGLHVNTVRGHLTVLAEAGLVRSEPEDRERPGRPRHVYSATVTADDAPGGSYRFLAQVLASYLAGAVNDPARASETAGRAWGRHLVERPAPFQRVAADAALARTVELLAELGFAPEVDEEDPSAPRILLHRCPFLDVAREHQEVVCAVHLGLMRGALDELGADVEATDLLPFVEPSLCVTHLAMPAS